MKLMSFDPGKTTGWAEFEDSEIVNTGQIEGGVDGVTDFLADYPGTVDIVVVESYMVRPDSHSVKANVGSDLETVQVYGAIRAWARMQKAQFIRQQPQIKKIAELHAGFKVKGKHDNTHWQDAVLHGVYYLVSTGRRKPKGLEGYDMQ